MSKCPRSSFILQPSTLSFWLSIFQYRKTISHTIKKKWDLIQLAFSFCLSSSSFSCHHNNPQPAIHSWNCYRKRQKVEALDVSLQGSSPTSLSPPGERWASCDLRRCQLGCKWSSCFCVLLAPGSSVGRLLSICAVSFQHPRAPSQNRKKLNICSLQKFRRT